MLFKTNTFSTLVRQFILTLLAVLFVIPLIIMLIVSFRGEGIGNYVAVLTHSLFPGFFINSLVVSISTVAVVFVFTLTAAYAFSKLNLPLKNVLLNASLIGLMLPPIALIVPIFMLIRDLGLFNNYLALIGPMSAFITPFTLLMAKNYMDDLPNQLLDAAKIDGCGSFRALLYVIAPLCKPISVVVIIWAFLNSWNEYFLALVFMRDEEMRMITQAPQYFSDAYTVDIGKVFAALVLISLPVMIAYLSMQKYFEDGMTSGSIK